MEAAGNSRNWDPAIKAIIAKWQDQRGTSMEDLVSIGNLNQKVGARGWSLLLGGSSSCLGVNFCKIHVKQSCSNFLPLRQMQHTMQAGCCSDILLASAISLTSIQRLPKGLYMVLSAALSGHMGTISIYQPVEPILSRWLDNCWVGHGSHRAAIAWWCFTMFHHVSPVSFTFALPKLPIPMLPSLSPCLCQR